MKRASYAGSFILAVAIALCGCGNNLPVLEQPRFILAGALGAIPNGTSNYALPGADCGAFSDTAFTITNGGTVDLYLQGEPTIGIDGFDAGLFCTVAPYPSLRLAPGESTPLNLRFHPDVDDQDGSKEALLRVYTNDPGADPYQLGIVAVAGSVPEIRLSADAVDIQSGTGIVGFPETLVGYETDLVLTIENIGNADLVLTGVPDLVVISGPDASSFILVDAPGPLLGPSASDTFTLCFAPGSGGSKSATVTIANTDADEASFELTVTGTARTSGALDATFGTAGVVETDLGGSESCAELAIRPDGRILTVGSTHWATYNHFAFVQYEADGTLDPTFGTDGVVTAPDGYAYDLYLYPDGRFLGAGTYHVDSQPRLRFARYLADGSPDTGFGTDGVVTLTGYGPSARVDVQSDGRIIVAAGSEDYVVMRFNTDGSPDSAFGDGGATRSDFGATESCSGVLVLHDDRILVYGSRSTDLAMVRYLADGTLDMSFGSAGIVTTDFSASSYESASDVRELPDGRLLVAGTANGDFALARYLADGSLDPSFGRWGRVTTDLGDHTPDTAATLAVQSDGRIIVGGMSEPNGSNLGGFALVRYLPDGDVDPTFGIDGRITTQVSPYSDAGVGGLAVQADGLIVAGGGPTYAFMIARYLP